MSVRFAAWFDFKDKKEHRFGTLILLLAQPERGGDTNL